MRLVAVRLSKGQHETPVPAQRIRGQIPRSTRNDQPDTSTAATTRTVAAAAAEPVRLHADHIALKRLGNWTSADRFEVRARRGSVVLDLRSPRLPAGELVVDLDLDRAMVKLLLPDDAVVDQRGHRLERQRQGEGRRRTAEAPGPRAPSRPPTSAACG